MTQGTTPQKHEPIIVRLARLSRADVPPEDFFRSFFDLIRDGLKAEAGSLWFYNSESRQLIPKVRALASEGPLKEAPDDVFSSVAYRVMEQQTPLLYYPDENAEAPALKNVGLMSVPVEVDNKISVVILVARSAGEGRAYTPEDVYTLQSLCVYLLVFLTQYHLRNAAILSNRLAKLAEIEGDLAGTSERDKMAFILANRSRELMTFDRVFVASPSGSGFRIAAISGVDDVQQGAAVQILRVVTKETARIGGDWHFTEGYLEKVEDTALRDRLALYFATVEYKSILLMRMEDDKGLLAVMGFERRVQDSYSQQDFQLLQSFCKVSAKGLRRAEEFRRLPGIALAKKAHGIRERAIGPRRNRFFLKTGALVAVLAILAFGKWGLVVRGDCRIEPYLATVAAARVEGRVVQILKTEGDRVKRGDVIALLDGRRIENQIGECNVRILQSKAGIAAYRQGDVAQMALEENNLKALELELEALKLDEEALRITSPQDGVIVTPRDEINAALDTERQRGDPIAKIADLSKLYVEVEVAERDIGIVRQGEAIEFVLKGDPGRPVRVKVEELSPATHQLLGKNVFLARGVLDNPDGRFHPGQTGTAKIPAGKRPLAYVIFRSTIDWVYTTIRIL